MTTCKWKLNNDNQYREFWETECEQEFSFNSGGPEENSYTYCPGCGNEIEVVEPEGEE